MANELVGLQVERRDYSSKPWRVVVADGPCAGQEIAMAATRRDAVAEAERFDDPLWGRCLLSPLDADGHALDLAVTTVGSLRIIRERVEHLEREVAVRQRVLLSVDGSAVMVEEARRAIAEEDARRAGAATRR